jgi:nitrous oxidase accessory protein NosD
MKHSKSSFIYTLFAVLTLGFLLSAQQARAETTQCTAITSLPATISTQGIYCFTGNLATNLASGNAIEITVNNVTIDMNGYKLGNLAAGAGTEAFGIFANQKKNITIRNGIIRGFLAGISLHDDSPYTVSSGHLVEDIRAEGNTQAGIVVKGTDNVIRNNQVVFTGGSTVLIDDTIPVVDAFGIVHYGPGARVINNVITETVGRDSDGSFGGGNGIWIFAADNSVVEDNRISDTLDVSGISYGIRIWGSSNVMVLDNRIATVDNGVAYTSSTGEYRDNMAYEIANTAYTGGTDGGGNN